MEDKTLNFTTQNSFLHYGVKGMKWGVITSLYEKIGQQAHGRAETATRNAVYSRIKQPRAYTTGSHKTYGGGSGRIKNATGKANADSLKVGDRVGGPVRERSEAEKSMDKRYKDEAKGKEEARKENRNSYKGMPERAIAISNAHAQGKMIGDDKEKEKTTAFAGIDQYADEYAADRGKYVNSVNKYVNAMDSIADMDPKYTKQFFDKYGEDITTQVKSYEQETALLYSRILYYTDHNPEALPDNLVKEVETRRSEIKNELYDMHISSDNDLVSAKEGMQYDDELIDKVLKNIK